MTVMAVSVVFLWNAVQIKADANETAGKNINMKSEEKLKKQQGNDNTLVPLALPRDRSFHQRLGLFDHWNGDGHLDRKSK